MTTAIRPVLTGGLALASAAVVAVTPLAPTADVHVPRVESLAVALTAAPPLGAIPYQALVNGLTDGLALAPILFGSTAQCTACIGPVANFNIGSPAVPFTGWGVVGIVTGLITAPVALVQTLVDTSDVGRALGAAVTALQTPITNTLTLIGAPRAVGGFALPGVLDRTLAVVENTLDAVLDITNQALLAGPLTVLTGVATGIQTFGLVLAGTGDIVEAFEQGIAPIRTAVDESVEALVTAVGNNRTTIYNDLTSGPGQAASPIPTIPAPPNAAVRAAAAQEAPQEEQADAVEQVAAAAGARKAAKAAAPAAAAGEQVSQAARDAVREAKDAGTRVGAAVKAAVGGPKRAAARADR